MKMFVLCAYLSAMAGITALCYVFRKRQEEVADQGPNDSEVNAADMEPKVDDKVPSIVITPATSIEKNRTRGRSPLTPETQAKIQEVLDFVNTPSDQLVLETDAKGSAKKDRSPQLELPVYSSVNKKKPKEVIDDLKQSKAKVEAWISKLDKVIHADDTDPVAEKHERRSRGAAAVKTNMLTYSTEARRNAHNERLAKVKEEVAKRRMALGNKAEGSRRREEEEKPSASKKGSVSPERSSGGVSHKRDGVEVPKRDTSASSGVRKRTSVSSKQSSNGSASVHTGDDQKTTTKRLSTTKEEGETKPAPSRSPTRRGVPTSQRQDGAATQQDKEATGLKTRARPEAKVETTQKTKTQAKTVSAFEARMKYVPPGRQPRISGEARTQAASSKIPLMVNSRVRPPVARTPKVPPQEQKIPPPAVVVQKPKKSIRITNEPLLLPRCADPDDPTTTPTPGIVEIPLVGRRSSSHTRGDLVLEKSHSAVFQRVTHTRGDVAPDDDDDDEYDDTQTTEVLPELNIIEVRGSKSSNRQPNDIQAEVHFAREVAARIAKSGPIRLNRNSSSNRVRSVSIANLRGLGSNHGQPMSQPVAVSKTVQLPEGTDDNVTVYFSVTMPRRANSDVNWNEHVNSEHTVTQEDLKIQEVEDVPTAVQHEEEDDDEEEEDPQSDWQEDDHSDDGIFSDEIIGASFPFESDNENDTDYPSSVGGYDEKEFDSCDEQF